MVFYSWEFLFFARVKSTFVNSKIFKAHLALLGANFIYGVNHIIAKGIMPHKIGATGFVFYRILGAGLMFWIIKLFIKEKVAKKDFGRLLICAVLGVAGNQLLFLHGLNLTCSTNFMRHNTFGNNVIHTINKIRSQ